VCRKASNNSSAHFQQAASSCLRSHGLDSVVTSGRIPFTHPSITSGTAFESGMTRADLRPRRAEPWNHQVSKSFGNTCSRLSAIEGNSCREHSSSTNRFSNGTANPAACTSSSADLEACGSPLSGMRFATRCCSTTARANAFSEPTCHDRRACTLSLRSSLDQAIRRVKKRLAFPRIDSKSSYHGWMFLAC
jgi:hypothetical protein